ncbi:MAG: hypothetical protein JWN03_5625 [Nocardia sp.]|uniref:hypothetical protein n=1 Tax=Nocardia sp. TaxID=1821 RepID=UPI00263511BD|nr:hypothetical protein [Nocardia sp.]MCU1645350.1 hypothetical protein [Nocardia sp.]
MTTLLVILIVWVVLSVPAALLLARMFRSGSGKRGRKEPELTPGATEFDRRADEFTLGPRAGEGDTHRVFPPR